MNTHTHTYVYMSIYDKTPIMYLGASAIYRTKEYSKNCIMLSNRKLAAAKMIAN